MVLDKHSPDPWVARAMKFAVEERNREQLAKAAEMRERLRTMREAHRSQRARLATRFEHLQLVLRVH